MLAQWTAFIPERKNRHLIQRSSCISIRWIALTAARACRPAPYLPFLRSTTCRTNGSTLPRSTRSTTDTEERMRRIDYRRIAPEAVSTMLEMQQYVDHCCLERPLLELAKLRASQINGCAYCVDMHSKDLRALGETEQRLYAVVVWREAPFFNNRERTALEWTEAV